MLSADFLFLYVLCLVSSLRATRSTGKLLVYGGVFALPPRHLALDWPGDPLPPAGLSAGSRELARPGATAHLAPTGGAARGASQVKERSFFLAEMSAATRVALLHRRQHASDLTKSGCEAASHDTIRLLPSCCATRGR